LPQIFPLIAADKTSYFKADFSFCGHLRCFHPRKSAGNFFSIIGGKQYESNNLSLKIS
jgi:hypothetical protein